MRTPTILSLALATALLPLAAHAEPQWIWINKSSKSKEQATFKTSFEVKGTVKSATLTFTCDNGAAAFVNGQKAGETPDWQQPTKADVTKLVNAGANELRFDAKNNEGVAALVATLTIESQNGKTMTIESGPEWQGAVTMTCWT